VDSRQGLDIYLKAVDTKQPDVPLAFLNVYHPRKTLEGLKLNVEGLYLMLENEFPLVEGTVQAVLAGKKVVTTLNREQRIRPGSQLLVFREIEHFIDQDGYDCGEVEIDIGELKVQRVDDRRSYASIMVVEPECLVRRGDHVITR